MATHFICQATEPIPHKFPFTRVPEKSHGAVSQYELLNLSDKAHCQFPPPGWDTSDTSEDSLPLYRVPAPSWKASTNLIGPDPDLCVTPEKSIAKNVLTQQNRNSNALLPTKHTVYSSVDPDLDLTLTPEKVVEVQSREHKSNLKHGINEDAKLKGLQRVRFELNSSKESSEGESFSIPRSGPTKPYKPHSYSDEQNQDTTNKLISEQDITHKNRPAQYTLNTVNSRTVYVPVKEGKIIKEVKLANHFDKSDTTDVKTGDLTKYDNTAAIYNSDSNPVCQIQNHKTQVTKVKTKDVRKQETQSDKLKNTFCVMSQDNCASKRKVKVRREDAEHPTKTDYSFPFSDGFTDSTEYEHVFNRPEYNSTLRMRKELQQIKDSEVDVAKALEKKLQLSDTKKTEIIEKATSKVNTKDSVYSGLVSLEIPIEDLCNQVEQTKSSRIPSSRPKPQAPKHSNEPDLMEFFTPDLQREEPELSLPGIPLPSEMLSTARDIRAFDLYRHNRVWDNNSYFSAKKKQ